MNEKIIRFGTLEALLAELASGAIVRTQTLTTSQTNRLGITGSTVHMHITAEIGAAIGVWTYRTGIYEKINGTNTGRYGRATVAAAHEQIEAALRTILIERGLRVKARSMFHVPAEALQVEGDTELVDIGHYYRNPKKAEQPRPPAEDDPNF